MTIDEAINILRWLNPPRANKNSFDNFIEAREMAIEALQKQRWIPVTEESVIQAGYEGREVRFRLHGRLFAIRELAQ